MFFSVHPGEPITGKLSYIRSDHSFDFVATEPTDLSERAGDDGVTSLTAGTLQLEVGVAEGAVLYLWGYEPMELWKRTALEHPAAQPGHVFVRLTEPLESGISVPLPWGEWSTRFDPDTGTVRIGPAGSAARDFVQCASGVVLGMHDGQVDEFWLTPSFE